jgi:hypothetical protein
MLSMEITTNQYNYRSGDPVEGELIIKSDEEFMYNAIHLTFTGREHTRIVVSHGKTSSVYTDERVYFSQRMDLANEGQMTVEGLQFPYHFALSENLPSSYNGTNGWIEYTLIAIIERSWARDPKEQVILELRNQEQMPPTESPQVSIEKDGYPILEIEMEEDVFSLGKEIELRFRVAQDIKIRGVRIELLVEEEAITEHYNRVYAYPLKKEYFEESMIERGLCVNANIATDRSMPSQFTREILSCTPSIKVTLDVPWARDKSIMIPIKLGDYVLPSERDTKQAFEFSWNS